MNLRSKKSKYYLFWQTTKELKLLDTIQDWNNKKQNKNQAEIATLDAFRSKLGLISDW